MATFEVFNADTGGVITTVKPLGTEGDTEAKQRERAQKALSAWLSTWGVGKNLQIRKVKDR